MRVAIIGGGPSGLAQLKVLLDAQKRFGIDALEVKLFEAHDKIGGIFYHHSYEEGELVSSKFLTTFSDHRPRPDDPDFFSTNRYLEYLDEYAGKFHLWPHIHLGTKVLSVRRGHVSEHIVTYLTPTGETVQWECDAIAVCSGVHSIPHIPDLPGIENVPVVMHSEHFKSREQFGKDKTVVILGSGETSADIAYLAVTGQTKRVLLCHRDGWLGAPKVSNIIWGSGVLQVANAEYRETQNRTSCHGFSAARLRLNSLRPLIHPRSPCSTPCMFTPW